MRQKSFYKNIHFIFVATFILSAIGLGVHYFLNGKKAPLYMGIATLLFFIFPLILKYKNIVLPYKLRIFTLVYLILGYNIGFIMDGYVRFMYFDKFVHFLSGLLNCIIGIVFFLYLNRVNKTRWLSTILFGFLFSMFIGLTCEFTECIVFLTTGYDAQHTLTTGAFDTMGDLTACLISSIMISIFYYIRGKDGRLHDNSIIKQFCKLNEYKL